MEAKEAGAMDTIQDVALIVGVTGLVGKELATTLARSGWKVYGVARNLNHPLPQHCQFISCDLLNPSDTMDKLSSLKDTTHLFWITWASQYPLDTQECCVQNKTMMLNALQAILPSAKALKHVCLQTGTKHYISVEAPVGNSNLYDEETPRASNSNSFYYVLEDLLREKLAKKVGWSIHRPGLLMGNSRRTVFNVMGSLCVYGSICRRLNLPFVFGGSRKCWEEIYMDASDARLVAKQQIWAATSGSTVAAEGEAFNAINGSAFTWKEIWPVLAAKFRLVVPENDDEVMFSQSFTYAGFMADKGSVWEEIVEKEGLCRTRMEDLANWWFLDALFRIPAKLLVSREKADRLGFTATCDTLASILYWVDCMRDERLIP